MRITLIGANGQLGTDLHEVLSRNHEVTALDHDDLEIADGDSVRAVIPKAHPNLVVSTAAFHDVPGWEKDPHRAFAVNASAQFWLATTCAETGATYVQFSTDYIFDGMKKSPYVEDDNPGPLNVHGVSKLAGEHLIRFSCPNHYIIRVSGLYGKVPCRAKGGNFVTNMLRLAKERDTLKIVNDEILTPTFTRDIAENVAALIETETFGTYHMTSAGQCSWHEFASEIFRLAGLSPNVIPVPSSEFPAPVARPLWSVLENQALKRIGCDRMRHWKDALGNYMRECGPF